MPDPEEIDINNADDAVSEYLVVYRSIEELQIQNERLLIQVRESNNKALEAQKLKSSLIEKERSFEIAMEVSRERACMGPLNGYVPLKRT
jgi:hypothetical protein